MTTLGTIIGISIILCAILVRWKKNSASEKASSSFSWSGVWQTIGILVALVMIFSMGSCGVGFYRWWTKPPANNTAANRPAPQPQEALVLMKECWTPCSANILWPFMIRTDGHALKIKFQGVSEWVDHPAEGDVDAPPQMKCGETKYKSPDEKDLHVRVQTYKRIWL